MGLFDQFFNQNIKSTNKTSTVRKKITVAFEDNIRECINNNLTNNPLTDGLILQGTIGFTYQEFKNNETLMQLSGMSEAEYEKMVEDI